MHWTRDGWKTQADVATRDTGLGLHTADLPTEGLSHGSTIVFTWLDLSTNHWVDQDYRVVVA